MSWRCFPSVFVKDATCLLVLMSFNPNKYVIIYVCEVISACLFLRTYVLGVLSYILLSFFFFSGL